MQNPWKLPSLWIVSTSRVRKISEEDTNEIHSAYQRAIKEKELIELENSSLKQELSRISRLVPSHSRSISNASSVNNEDDFGYSSSKNTLENKKNSIMLTPPTHHLNHNDSSSQEHSTPDSFAKQSICFSSYILKNHKTNICRHSCQLVYAKTVRHGAVAQIAAHLRRGARKTQILRNTSRAIQIGWFDEYRGLP